MFVIGPGTTHTHHYSQAHTFSKREEEGQQYRIVGKEVEEGEESYPNQTYLVMLAVAVVLLPLESASCGFHGHIASVFRKMSK